MQTHKPTPPPLSGEGSVGDVAGGMVPVPRWFAKWIRGRLSHHGDYTQAQMMAGLLAAATVPDSDAAPGTADDALPGTADDWRKELKRVVGGTFGSTLPAQEVTDGWQGMESAPRNGSAILIYQPWKSGRATICIGHYANGWVNQMCLYCAHDQHKEFGYELGNEVTEIGNEHCQPTHWRPLPAPPESALRTGEGPPAA